MKLMIQPRLALTTGLAMLLLASVAPWAPSQEQPASPAPAKGTKTVKPKKADAEEEPVAPEAPGVAKGVVAAQNSQGLGAFGRVLPLGEKNLDVKIPSFKDGVPSSTVRAQTMTRLDDDNMEMEGMDIRLFGETHDRDVRISLPTANYHMPTQILSSDKRSRVSRSDFDLQGDSMIFDTRTRQGTMTGNVRMVIHDMDSLSAAPKKEGEAVPGNKPEGTNIQSNEPTAKPATELPAAPAVPASPSPTPNEKK